MAGISISIDIEDIPEPEISEDMISEWIEARLNEARNLFIERVSRGGGGGRTYRRGRRGTHQASAPGEYPVTDQGQLVGSIDYEMTGPREGTIYSNLRYAKYLDEGTQHMAARRMLRDVLQEVRDRNPGMLASAAKIE